VNYSLKWIEKDDLINFTCLISCLVSNKNEIVIDEVSESSLAENKKKPVRHGSARVVSC
jgi:hypothetical protein